MRVVLVVPSFPKLSETFVVSKFLGLLERGHDVYVVCQRSDAKEWVSFPQLGGQANTLNRVGVCWPVHPQWVPISLLPLAFIRCFIRVPVTATRYLYRGWRRFGFNVLGRFYVDTEIILRQPDIIHFEFGALAVGRTYLRELLNCKVVSSFRGHDLNFVKLDEPQYYDKLWSHLDAVHCLSKSLWLRALERGCPADVTPWLIPPAVDLEFFNLEKKNIPTAIGTKERPIRLLSVGRLNWTKGYEFALQALTILRRHGMSLEYRIVGAGESLDCISFCRYQLGLEDCVSLMGALSPLDVRCQMRWADIFLHSAVSEGFGNAVLEAQAMQLPVVTTDANGLPENVLDGVTGYVVSRRNAQALAYKIIRLAYDGSLRDRMGRAGRQRVEKYFHFANQIAAFENLYHQLMLSQYDIRGFEGHSQGLDEKATSAEVHGS